MSQMELKSVDVSLPGLPSIPEESWRRTDPELFFLPLEEACSGDGQPLLEKGHLHVSQLRVADVREPALGEGAASRLVATWLKDNDCAARTAVVTLTRGLAEVSLPAALQGWIRVTAAPRSTLGPVFTGSAIGNALADRLSVATNGGLRIDVTAQISVKNPILLIVTDGVALESSLVSLHIAPEAVLSLGFVSHDAAWAHRRYDVFVGDRAKVDAAWIHAADARVAAPQVLQERKVVLGAHAELRDVHVVATGGLVRSLSNIVFEGEGGRSESGAALLGTKKARIDFEPIQEHRVGQTSSSLKAKVLVDDDARAVFQGLIIVAKSAPHTNALQDNKNLLLGPKAAVDAMPRLEIYPDDVVCKHGSATGEVDFRQVYYLTTRGFSDAQARSLIVGAFVADGLGPLGSEHDLHALCEKALETAFAASSGH